MKVISFDVDTIDDVIEVIPIADSHIGSHQWNESLFKATIDYVSEKPNRYCVLNGDIVDNATRNSIGSGIFENDLTPSQSIAIATKYLYPIKDKIICYTSGNHEARSDKDCGISPADFLATNLGIEDRFSKTSCYIFLNLKKGYHGQPNKRVCYHMFISHGRGGGRTIGAKANALESMCSVVEAEIYIHSHTHTPITFKQDYLGVDETRKILVPKERLFVNTNAFLHYENGYGEVAMYKPASQSIPKIYMKTYRDTSNNLDRLYKKVWAEI